MTTELTRQQRIEVLSQPLRDIMEDFKYDHLVNDDLKETSKIFHDAMLALCENAEKERTVCKYTAEAIRLVGIKIWEGKNLAVHFKVKGNL